MILFIGISTLLLSWILILLGVPWYSLLIGAVIAFLIGWFLG